MAGPVGDVLLHVVEDRETRFRARLTVVPPAFQCHLLPGQQARSGVLRFEHSGAVDLSCQAPDGVGCAVEKTGPGRFEVRVQSGPVPPASLGVALLFPGGGEARLAVPFPSAVPGFVDRAGRPLEYNAEIPLAQMVGAFAVVHAPRPKSKFRLRCRLNWGGPGWVDLADLESREGETAALSLDVVRDLVESLLTSTDALDAFVELRLVEMGAGYGGRPVQIRVRHYEAALKPEDAEGGTAKDLVLGEAEQTALGKARVAALRVEARPIEAPGEEPVELEPVGAGRWRFDMAQRAPGGWLVSGRIESVMVLRSILLSVRGEELAGSEAGEAGSEVGGEAGGEVGNMGAGMVQAVRMPQRSERKHALHAVVEALGSDFGHPNWRLMMDYLDTLKMLPASTFDPVKAMAKVPDAVVRALFLARSQEHFDAIWDGLEDLPFSWKLVPVRSWLRAARAYPDYVVAMLGDGAQGLDPHGLAHDVIERTVARAAQRSLHLGWLSVLLTGVLGRELAGLKPPEVARDERRQALLRQLGRWWPEWSYPEDLDVLLDDACVPAHVIDGDPVPHRRGVLNAPVLAAAAAVDGHALDEHLMFELRRMRAFDEDWFEHAHAHAFMHILHARTQDNPGFLS